MFEEYNDILTIGDLQSALHIGKSAAYKLINSGEINYIRIGNRIRIPKSCLLDYVNSSCYNTINNGGLSCQDKEV